jgi:CheY-like chemotaxis protein
VTILLVEDHIATLRAMEMLLKSNGYTVLAAATAEEALKIAEHQPCDVLVSDIMLPGQSGIDLMREMKTRYGTRGIAVTGSVIFDDPQDALDVGFSRCIKKPVVFTALMKAVEEILQQTPASAPFVS